MTSLCFPGTPGRPHRLVSSSDEKILRVFDAPSSFLRLLRGVDGTAVEAPGDTLERVEQAYVPELGLSNKVRALRWHPFVCV
jgi:elongator complex protein 2